MAERGRNVNVEEWKLDDASIKVLPKDAKSIAKLYAKKLSCHSLQEPLTYFLQQISYVPCLQGLALALVTESTESYTPPNVAIFALIDFNKIEQAGSLLGSPPEALRNAHGLFDRTLRSSFHLSSSLWIVDSEGESVKDLFPRLREKFLGNPFLAPGVPPECIHSLTLASVA